MHTDFFVGLIANMCLFPESLITLDGAPFGLPSQDPLAIHLVLLVAAHDSERDHFLLGARRTPSEMSVSVRDGKQLEAASLP